MSDYRILSRRLTRLEQKQGMGRQLGKMASLLDSETGRLFLEAQPAKRQQALLLADHFCSEDLERAMHYPPLRARIEADCAAWRAQRGLPPRDSEAALESW